MQKMGNVCCNSGNNSEKQLFIISNMHEISSFCCLLINIHEHANEKKQDLYVKTTASHIYA